MWTMIEPRLVQDVLGSKFPVFSLPDFIFVRPPRGVDTSGAPHTLGVVGLEAHWL